MTKNRRSKILDLLRRGGAINLASGNFTAHYLGGSYPLKEQEVSLLLDEGSLVVINCGCTGFWLTLRPDLVASLSAAAKRSTD